MSPRCAFVRLRSSLPEVTPSPCILPRRPPPAGPAASTSSMRLFVLSGVLHLLIALRLVPALPLAGAVAVAAWLLASAVLVPMGLMARRYARPPRSDQLAAAGLFAMGLFSSLFVLT